MILETETELVVTYEKLARLYHLADRMSAELSEDKVKDQEIEGVRAMIRKMERQVAAFYESHPDRLKLPQRVA